MRSTQHKNRYSKHNPLDLVFRIFLNQLIFSIFVFICLTVCGSVNLFSEFYCPKVFLIVILIPKEILQTSLCLPLTALH